jgi:hypothetical protein
MNRPSLAELDAISAKNRNAWRGHLPDSIDRPAAVQLPPITLTPKANKFNAVKSADGDSKKEVRRLQELRLLQAAGQIHSLIPQVRYRLIPAQTKTNGTIERALTYTCDFQYVEAGRLVVEDCKSPPTRALPRYIAARKMMLQLYDIEIREV